MKTRKFKGSVLLGIEADNLDEAQELAADEAFLKSLAESEEVKVTKIKCNGVEETDPGFFDLSCTISGEVSEDTDLKKCGISEE